MNARLAETQTQSAPDFNNISIPEGFLLGAATSAHQVEGDNFNSDWWFEEKNGKLPESGKACDHYNRYEEDFGIAQSIGLNAFRISIEWSRIEPLENQWDRVAIEHYRKVLVYMKKMGLTRMVTLHHFTLPQWLAEKQGFETSAGVEAFARFAWFVAQNLGDEVDLWCTINEPEVYAQMGYFMKRWPPFKSNYFLGLRVFYNLSQAHIAAYKAIKQTLPNARVGLAKNNVYYAPYENKFGNKLLCNIVNFFGNRWFLNRISKHVDYIGLNYYFSRLLNLGRKVVMNHDSAPLSDMGWQTYPIGIYHLLLDLKRYNVPVYITENGIANARDDMRKDYIRQHLAWALKAKAEGVNLKGYFYWSLVDNYEWSDGYNPRFGLVEVDYQTQVRKIRPSAEVFKELKNA